MAEVNSSNENQNLQPEEQEIDIMELITKFWKQRKRVLVWCAVGAVIGLVAGFSIPATYSASAVLAPETEESMGSGVSSIASMMGVNLDNSVDAINFQLFPDVVSSTPFIYGLFDLEVETADGELRTTLLDYMKEHQKAAWWSCVVKAPFQLLGWVKSWFSKEEEPDPNAPLDMYNLPKKERGVIKYFAENITLETDKKTGKTTVSLEMQDPLVVTTVLNAVLENLKDYTSDYRTSKARQDVENLSVICAERKSEYYAAQQAYARYSDANKNVILQSAQAEQERLQQEMNLAFQVYSQVATQLEAARIKEQEAKPVFAIVQPPVVPLEKSAPSKAKYLVIFTFLAGCCAAAWILFGEECWNKFRTDIKN